MIKSSLIQNYGFCKNGTFEILGVKYEIPDKDSDLEKKSKIYAKNIFQDYETRRIGQIMFKYRDTYGLPFGLIEKEVAKYLESKEYEEKMEEEIYSISNYLLNSWKEEFSKLPI